MGLSACLLPSTDPTPRPGVRGGPCRGGSRQGKLELLLRTPLTRAGLSLSPGGTPCSRHPKETLATLALASSPQTGREHSLGSGERRPADTRPAVRTTRAAALPRAPVARAVVTVWQRECGQCHQATVWLTQDCGVPWWGRSVLPPGLPQETWEAGHH